MTLVKPQGPVPVRQAQPVVRAVINRPRLYVRLGLNGFSRIPGPWPGCATSNHSDRGDKKLPSVVWMGSKLPLLVHHMQGEDRIKECRRRLVFTSGLGGRHSESGFIHITALIMEKKEEGTRASRLSYFEVVLRLSNNDLKPCIAGAKRGKNIRHRGFPGRHRP